jgi:hypothetical protein
MEHIEPLPNVSTASLQPPALPNPKGTKRKQSLKKRFRCNIDGCLKDFSTSGHLTRHSKIHSGEKPHICPLLGCDSRFSRKDNMLQHFAVHKKKLYLCEEDIELKPVAEGEIQYSCDVNPELVNFKKVRSSSISSPQSVTESLKATTRSRAFTTNSIPNLNKEWKPYSPVTSSSDPSKKLDYYVAALQPFTTFQSFGTESDALSSQFQLSSQHYKDDIVMRERILSGNSMMDSSQGQDYAIKDFEQQVRNYTADPLSGTEYLISRVDTASPNSYAPSPEYFAAASFPSSTKTYSSGPPQTYPQSYPTQSYSESKLPQQSYSTSNSQQGYPSSSLSQNYSASSLPYSEIRSSISKKFPSPPNASSASKFSPSSNLPPNYSASPSPSASLNYTGSITPSLNLTGPSSNQSYSLPKKHSPPTTFNSDYPISTSVNQSFSASPRGVSFTGNVIPNYAHNPGAVSNGNQRYSGRVSGTASNSLNYSATASKYSPPTTLGTQHYSAPTSDFSSSLANNRHQPSDYSDYCPSQTSHSSQPSFENPSFSFQQISQTLDYPSDYKLQSQQPKQFPNYRMPQDSGVSTMFPP